MTAYDTLILAESGLVAYYALDETSGTAATDQSSNANTGTYTGTFTLAAAAKDATLLGTAVSFAGGQITAPSIAALNITGDLTLECWVYPTTRGNYYWLVSKLVSNGASTNAYEWRLENSTGIPNFLDAGASVSATTAPTLNQWSHVAVTISGTTVTHYLNGDRNGSGTLGGSRATTTTVLRIGSREDGFSTFTGRLDAVAIYNVAKTQAALVAHLAGFPGGNARNTQETVEAVVSATAKARVSQVTVEVVPVITATARVTQRALEVLAPGTPNARATQAALEVLAGAGTINARATQVALEVLVPSFNGLCYDTLILAEASLKGYYKLDETAGTTLVDSAPTAHNGTYTNSPTLAAASGFTGLGTAVTFNGSTQYASVPSNTDNDIHGSAITVECWVKQGNQTANTYNRIFSKGPTVNGSPFINYGILTNDISGTIEMDIANNSGTLVQCIASGFVPVVGTWYHVVGTYDGATIRLYLNGALYITAAQSGTILSSNQPLMIGASQRGGVVAEYFTGTVDACAIYNAVLDPATIMQHYLARNTACVAATARSQAVFVG